MKNEFFVKVRFNYKAVYCTEKSIYKVSECRLEGYPIYRVVGSLSLLNILRSFIINENPGYSLKTDDVLFAHAGTDSIGSLKWLTFEELSEETIQKEREMLCKKIAINSTYGMFSNDHFNIASNRTGLIEDKPLDLPSGELYYMDYAYDSESDERLLLLL